MKDEVAFVTKDSGERKVFASGMQRDTTHGKLLWHLVTFGPMLKRWIALLTRGAIKYDENNWMKANGQEELDRFKASACRHFFQWIYGLEPDEDHAAAIFFNVNGAEYVKERLSVPEKNCEVLLGGGGIGTDCMHDAKPISSRRRK